MTILETQVTEIQEDVTGLNEDVIGLRVDHTQLEGDVNFLFDEQVIQDQRLFSLEQTTDGIIGELDLIEDDFESVFKFFLRLDIDGSNFLKQ